VRARIALVSLIAAAGAALLAAPAGAAVTPNPWLENRFLNIAHQGGEDEAPSNTLYAFKSAMTEGNADMLELDVHLTEDGHVVVIHDDTYIRTACLDSLCPGPGSAQEPQRPDTQIRDLTLAEVKGLDAGYWFRPGTYGHDYSLPDSAFPFRGIRTGEQPPPAGYSTNDFTIPTLAEVFDAFPNTPINIEIKMPKSQDPANPYPATCGTADGGPSQLCDDLDLAEATTEALADMLKSGGPYDHRRDVIVVSFAEPPLEQFNDLATLGFVGGTPFDPDVVALQVPPRFGALEAAKLLANPPYDVQEQGYALHVWTNSDYDETFPGYKEMTDLGVDGIMTTSPRNLNAFLCQEGIPHPDGTPRCAQPKPKPKCKRKKKGKGKKRDSSAGPIAAVQKKGKKKRKCKRKKKRKKGKRK
jgi:glycerophosphoryl diester phosphodiesterase